MPAPTNLTPFLPARPSGITFIALNILRALSIVALLLVFSSNIVTWTNDIRAIKHTAPMGADGEEEWECEYIEYSTVPDQTGGAFWSVLNRLFILFECLILVFSEIGVPRRLFEEFIPILGPAHGMVCLGVFQALIAASVLSHFSELFPQVSAWLLFNVGCLNMIAGLVWRQKGKEKRLIFSWENVSSLTPQTRMAHTAWQMASPASSAACNPKAERAKQTDAHHSKLDEEAGFTSVPLERKPTTASESQSPLLPAGVGQNIADRFAGVGKGLSTWGFGRKAEERVGVKISRPVESLPREGVVSMDMEVDEGGEARDIRRMEEGDGAAGGKAEGEGKRVWENNLLGGGQVGVKQVADE